MIGKRVMRSANRGLGCVVFVAATLPAMPAFAQQSQAANPAQTATEPEVLKAITVTARRREENAQDVPTPTSSVRGDDLAINRISQVQDLQQALPSTQASFMHPRVSSVAVRGLGSNPANEGLEGSVGLYVDNVFLGRPGMLAIDLVDLEQVDLLRGPQGTLFGKNTTAGVLNITTKKPTFTPESSIEVSAGERGYYQTLASFSGPINEKLAGRLSLSKTHDDGWLKNNFDGKNYDSLDRQGARGQLLIKPDAGFDLRLSGDHNSEDDTQGTLVPYGFGPSSTRTYQQVTTLALGLPAGSTPIQTDPTKYEVNFNGTQRNKVDQGGLSAEANWHLPSGFDVTSITAWRYWNFEPHNDNDYTTASGIADGGFVVKDQQYSQELRLASPKDEKFDYVVGAYYFNQNITSDQFVKFGNKADLFILNSPAGLGILDNGSTGSHGKATTDSYALFGQGNLHINDKLDFTTGLRYSNETKKGSVVQDPLTGVAASANATVLGTRAAVVTPWNSGDVTLGGDSWSYLETLSYRYSDSLLGYTSISHGEKSGAINISSTGLSTVASLLIRPEKSDNFEIGFKSALLNKRLTLNANYFYTQVSDYQTTGYVLPTPTSSSRKLLLLNAGDVTTQGVELEAKAQATRNLTLSANASYNLARYSKFKDAPCSAEALAAGIKTCDLTGSAVVGAPDWIVNLGGRYNSVVADGINQYISANYAWRSEAQGAIDDSKYAVLPAYGLLNLAIGWQVPQGKNNWDVSLWARNALDQHYFQLASTVQTVNSGAYVAAAGAPRTLGVTARLDF